MVELSKVLVKPSHSIRQTMECIDHNAKGIAVVVDEDGHLLGTVTDGDIRRAILAGISLDWSVQTLIARRAPTAYPSPIKAPAGTSDAELLEMMNEYMVRHIPLVDGEGRVVDIALLSELVKEYDLPLRAVIMAGGYGTRLRPLTEEIPKPMLPVGDRPLLEHIIAQLRQAGIRRVNLTTHYKSEVIAKHFGDGRAFGVEIQYVREDQAMGTAGALSLLGAADEPLLVMNGDILTRVDFRAMLDFHREHKAQMTVAVRQFEFRVPYGVIESDGPAVKAITEKPVLRYFINAGIYLLDPDVCRLISEGQVYDMPDLINRLLETGRLVVSFPVREYWLDIGKLEDYQKALTDVKNGVV